MAIPLRVLLVEDNPSDAELILYELRWAGFDPDSLRVETEDDFLDALDLAPDIILADFRLPQYDGLRALDSLKERGLDIPFIIISGNIGEELAASAIKQGAADYLLKDRMVRLGPAVKQALTNREVQQQTRAALAALHESESRFHLALKNSPVAVFNQDLDLRYTWIHNTHSGFNPQDVLGKTDAERFPPDEAARLTEIKRQVLATGAPARDEISLTFGRHTVYQDLSVEPMLNADGHIIGVAGVSIDITERKLAEQSLRRHNDYLVALQETTLDLLSQLDLNTLLEKIVRRAGAIMGTFSGYLDLVDLETGELRPQIGLGILAESLHYAVQPGEGLAGVVWQTKQPVVVDDYDSWSGRIGTFSHQSLSSIIGVPLLAGSNVLGVLGLGHEYTTQRAFDQEDVEILTQFGRLAVLAIENARLYSSAQQELAERKRTETALRESDERFRAIFDQAAVGIAQVATDGRWLRINQKLCAITGYTHEELLTKSFQEITHPDDLDLDLHYVHQMLTGEISTYAMEKRYLRKDGLPVWVNLTVSLVHDDQGAPAYFISIVEDIAERKRTAEQMALQSAALASAANAIVITDRDGTLQWMNPAFGKLTGYSPAEALGHNPRELIRSGIHEKSFYTAMWRTVLSGQVWHGELINRRKDGTLYAEEQTITPVLDALGNITNFVGIKQNIDERKHAETEREKLLAQIQEQAKQMEQVLATVPTGVLLLDAQGTILQANPVAERDLAALAGVTIGDTLVHLGDRPLFDLLDSPRTKGMWHEIKADKRTFEIISRPVDNGVDPEQWVLVINEVTREREVQLQLQQQERLAALGQLAAGIAHDFNNIMATIVLYAQMVARSEKIDDRNRKKMEIVNQQAWHASRLIEQLLDFSRRSVLQQKPLDLLPMLKEQVKLLERTLPENVEIHLNHGQGEYRINADPTRIQQMITNLAINARDAMPDGGILWMDLARAERRETDAIPKAGPESKNCADGWITLTLKDTGLGIPPEILPNIFDPFFTTKEPGSGTGLGLAQVHGIVGQHGGQITVDSAVGQGATFTICLPALPTEPTEGPLVERDATIPQGDGELILVVEDQEVVRSALVDFLELIGYQAMETSNGRKALEVMQEHGDEVALILSDVVMPVMGGIALFHALRQQAWKTPVIMLTGHPLDENFDTLRQEGLTAWLTKPVELDQLAQTIANALKTA